MGSNRLDETLTDLYYDLKWAEKQQRESPAPSWTLHCEIERIKALMAELELLKRASVPSTGPAAPKD